MHLFNKFIKKLDPLYYFPILVTLFFLVLVVFGLNGSSSGIYQMLVGKEPNLLLGEARTIRTDEWVVNTPFTVSQATKNYPLIDDKISEGQDMSVVIDVPYKDWSIIFKPQNWSFFLLPLSIAFAMKWWFLSWALVMSVYVFCVNFTKKYLLSSIVSLLVLLSPFIQWWYQSITILPIVYSLLIPLITYHLLRVTKIKIKIVLGLTLSYLLTCFALIMYPAFQIPMLFISIAIFISLYLKDFNIKNLYQKRHILWLLLFLIISLVPICFYILQHWNVIQIIQSTSYPGSRYIKSGGASINHFAYWPYNYKLQFSNNGLFGANQSEASTFLLLGYLFIPNMFYKIKTNAIRNKDLDNQKSLRILFYSCLVVSLLIFIRMYIPGTDFIFKFFALSAVPHNRLFIAIGMISIILVFINFTYIYEAKKVKGIVNLISKYYPLIYATVSFIFIFLLTGFYKKLGTVPSLSIIEIVTISILIALIIGLLVSQYYKLKYTGLFILLLFSIFSSVLINPLQKGVVNSQNNSLLYKIKDVEKEDSKQWITIGNFWIESVPLMAGAEVVGGVNTYPQLKTWKKFFPDKDEVYNRYAHVQFEINDSKETAINLVGNDSFKITTGSCSNLIKDLDVGYIVSSDQELSYKCFYIIYNENGIKIYKYKN